MTTTESILEDTQTETRTVDEARVELDVRPTPNARHRWVVRGTIVGVAVVLIAVGLTFLPSAVPSPTEDATLTHKVARGKLVVSVTEQGTLESSNNTEIKCKVRGFSTVTWVIEPGTLVARGDEVVRLDTKVLEEQYSLTKTNTFIAQATLERSKANVRSAEIAIDAYHKGRYRSQLQQLEKELEEKKRNMRVARKMLNRAEDLFKQGYVNELEVEGNAFTVTQAELELKVKETEIMVLREFTRKMEMATLEGNLIAARSKLAADEAGLAMEIKRRDRANNELEQCIIRAPRDGMVIYPSAAAWKRTPDITQGATVRHDQVLLLIPDLTKMRVKVGIHESVIDRVHPGLRATVTLPDRTLEANVTTVASVTRPAGWWTGNVVKYDAWIDLPTDQGLKPGMSAEVKVVMAEYDDVLTIPVAAVIETEAGAFCWVRNSRGAQRRRLELGDNNDVFVIVNSGLQEGDEVVLNPTTFLEDAEQDAARTVDATKPTAP